MKKYLSLAAALLLMGFGCGSTEPAAAPYDLDESKDNEPAQAEHIEKMPEAAFDTNDYLDGALEDLDAIDGE